MIGKNEFYDLVTSDFDVTLKLLDLLQDNRSKHDTIAEAEPDIENA